MPSPFPGMNPYLEHDAVWEDFHQGFIYAARAAIVPLVEPRYVVKAEEYVFLHELTSDARFAAGRSDVAVAALGRELSHGTAGATAVAPAYVEIPSETVDAEHHSYLTIRDRQRLDVVTVIDLLSPANKTGADRAAYVDKRRRYLLSGINLVELDLLRGGVRLPLTGLRSCDYYAMVARREEQPQGGIWHIQLRERLPIIPIPLRPPDADVSLDLQKVLNRVYDEAGYVNYVYRTPPKPTLNEADNEWARRFVPE